MHEPIYTRNTILPPTDSTVSQLFVSIAEFLPSNINPKQDLDLNLLYYMYFNFIISPYSLIILLSF